MHRTFFLFGAGYSGYALAAQIKAQFGSQTQIFGTTRHAENMPFLKAAGITPYLLHKDKPFFHMQDALAKTTHLIITIPPQAGVSGLGLPAKDLATYLPKLEWLAYFSTLGVYGNKDGAWIDETASLSPELPRNLARLKAEEQWQAFANQQKIPAAILRLGGIYGDKPNLQQDTINIKQATPEPKALIGRNAFRRLKNKTARSIVKDGQVFNYIHVADIAGATCHLAAKNTAGVYNLCDDTPSPSQDVISFAAKLMGKSPPPKEDFETAQISEAMRGFYQANRRVLNTKIRQAGYHFRFPDYKAGLSEMWQKGSW